MCLDKARCGFLAPVVCVLRKNNGAVGGWHLTGLAKSPFELQDSFLNIMGKEKRAMKFLIGLAVGYFLGLLMAPMPGAELRQQLIHRIDEAAREEAGRIGERAGEATYEKIKKAI